MSDNPQDIATPYTAPPKEPGEIGWPANFSAPGDASASGVATATPYIHEGVLVNADGSAIDGPTAPPVVAPTPVAPEPEPEPEPEPKPEHEHETKKHTSPKHHVGG